MKMVKSLLLGTAAGLVAVAGAQAADMPVKAKPVQYVKICSLYGDGFYYIPGTDTCIKMGGYLRVQAEYNMGAGGIALGSGAAEGAQARQTRDLTNDVNYRTRAAISWDVRQQTEYGTLRTYIRTGIQVTTPADTEGGNVFWDRAFMQFAGFTVGKTQSFFDLFTYGGAYSLHNVRTAGDTGAAGLTVWAYTAQFGNGVSGTLSAESPIGHNRASVLDLTATNFFNANGAVTADNAFSSNAGGNGFRMPDVIANLRVDQAWGFAGVSFAVHDASGAYYGATNNVNNGHPSDKLGWAAAVGGLLNLPGGDQAGINFAYAEGATGYVTNIGNGMSIYNASTSVGFGWISDGVFTTGTEVELTRSWSVNAMYQHIWNEKWKTSCVRRLRQHRLQLQCHDVYLRGAGGPPRGHHRRRAAGRLQLQPRFQLLRNRLSHAVEPGAATRYRFRSALFEAEHRVQGTGHSGGQRFAARSHPGRRPGRLVCDVPLAAQLLSIIA